MSGEIRWCLLPTKCERCRRPLWLVRALERPMRIPIGLPIASVFVRTCLVCAVLEPARAESRGAKEE